MVSTAPPLAQDTTTRCRIERAAGQCDVKRAGSMPSARRSPISRNSSATSFVLQFLVDDQAVAVPSTRISQASGLLLGFGGVTAAVDVEPAMRAGTDAGIFVAAPVNQVVPALGAGPRVIETS